MRAMPSLVFGAAVDIAAVAHHATVGAV